MDEVLKHAATDAGMITLTESARAHLLSRLAKQPGAGAIRLTVKKTGCSGLSYVFDYVDCPAAGDVIQALDETGVLAVDRAAWPFLRGLHMDYVQEGLNRKLIFQNPNQKGQCGCGESFTVHDTSSG